MARGGRRVGGDGIARPNRTDLAMKQPIRVAPSQTYGDAAAAERQQRAVPLPTANTPPGATLPSPIPPGGQPGAPIALAPPPGAAAPTPPPAAAPPSPAGPISTGAPALPGQLGFRGPTTRPNEPVTAGLPNSPGPGPEVLGMMQPSSQLGQRLQQLASSSPSPDLQSLAAIAKIVGV